MHIVWCDHMNIMRMSHVNHVVTVIWNYLCQYEVISEALSSSGLDASQLATNYVHEYNGELLWWSHAHCMVITTWTSWDCHMWYEKYVPIWSIKKEKNVIVGKWIVLSAIVQLHYSTRMKSIFPKLTQSTPTHFEIIRFLFFIVIYGKFFDYDFILNGWKIRNDSWQFVHKNKNIKPNDETKWIPWKPVFPPPSKFTQSISCSLLPIQLNGLSDELD